MSNNEEVKKLSRNIEFIVIIVMNLVFTLVCAIMILWPLTFTQVPLNEVHNWYGKDLHTYLVFTHSLATGVWLLGEGVINILWIIHDKKGK